MIDNTPSASDIPAEGLLTDSDSEQRDLADVPAVEVIGTLAVHLMSAAAVKLGLAENGEADLDLDSVPVSQREYLRKYFKSIRPQEPDANKEPAQP